MVEGFEDVGAALVADGQPPEAAEPSQGALDHPAMPSQALAALDAAPGDPVGDVSPAQGTMTARQIVSFIGVELGWALAGPSPALADRRHGIDQLVEDAAVVDICRRDPESERDAPSIGEEMALAAGSAAIGRIGAGLLAPLLAGTEALSTQARLQSMALARPKRSSRTRCSLFQMPAACHSRSRRQHVIPEPQPISWGSISQGIPLFSTNRMPVSAARFGSGRRPPFGLGRSGGSSGSIAAHSSSDTRGLAIHPGTAALYGRSRFC